MSHHKPAELTIPNTSKMVLISLQLKPLFITLNKDTTVPTLHLVSTTLKYIIAETCGGLQVSENSERLNLPHRLGQQNYQMPVFYLPRLSKY